MSFSITRRFQFCAGHRVLGHEGKCANMHGHNYILHATFEADQGEQPLDDLGRVIDFSRVKEILGTWLDDNWDHGFIYSELDADLETVFTLLQAKGEAKHKHFVAPFNPTAENMAEYLLKKICPILFRMHGVVCKEIRLEETENCCATVKL